ncbi:FAD/NAD(P)-binding domain-containing protein [Tothia fuscella]|uniref:FAD/NAD(P)-binding domain-containing protein n=1 Tax=Tothia fuscella TaxID=1048955 RepID=A0A9P4TY55_9PEZI|nr:FAD/NAD(P)-binding domain-containing protein [Tothia fuscella]
MKFVELLYNTLPIQSKVKLNQSVVDILQDALGVSVILADGSVEQGDIVVASDGVHSYTRELMYKHANNQNSAKKLATTLQSRYKCLFGISSLPSGQTAGDMVETHYKNMCIQLLCQAEHVFWFLFVKLETPTTVKVNYTEEEALAFAKQYMDTPVTSSTSFRDLWQKGYRFTLANLEEGVQKQWHSGRIVLLGDAAHKMTPNLAFGFNNALESAASLTNHLHKLLESSSIPTENSISAVFKAYQTQRFSRAKFSHDLTAFYTSFAAWENSLMKWASIITPKILPETFPVDQLAKLVKGAVKLEFLEVPERELGTVAFDDEVETKYASSMAIAWIGGLLAVLVTGVLWSGIGSS